MLAAAPESRLRRCNDRPENTQGRYVLYWCTQARRTRSSWALQHALWLAEERGCPLLVLEGISTALPWSSARFHCFAFDGMLHNRREAAAAGLTWLCVVERPNQPGRGLVAALSEGAKVVVTDDFPCSPFPRMLRAQAARLAVSLVAVDGNGLLPLGTADRVFSAAVHLRRFLQRELAPHLLCQPLPEPLQHYRGGPVELEPGLLSRWSPATEEELGAGRAALISSLPIDQDVRPVAQPGGAGAGAAALERFVRVSLPRYATSRSEPDAGAQSGLSPYLHWGHLGAAEVAQAVWRAESWEPGGKHPKPNGRKEGWWGMSASAEAFLDELVTWRELGFNLCALQPDEAMHYEGLPAWAREVLEAHSADARDPCYSLEQLEQANTHDPLWNAAQRQLLREGVIHNYLRMLWGKKILEWSPSPREAFARLVQLNNRWALDGRDPNSYSGIGWVLGRYDRPWPPRRPIYGTIRTMSSSRTAQKLSVAGYLERYAP